MNREGLSVRADIFATTSDLAEPVAFFVDRLPVGMEPDNSPLIDVHEKMESHHIDFGHTVGARGARKKASIVVLDPSPISLLALAGVLDSQGYGCVCARDGDAAIGALAMGTQDLIVADVGEDAAATLATIERMRSITPYEQLPAVLIADARWAGLENKIEAMKQATRCLFKPIDPNSLIAVVDQVLWMPQLVDAHRRRGSSPTRPGWVTL
jgi:CheY-like chemotaxis protein